MKNFNLRFTRLSEGQEFRNRKLITFFNIPVSKRVFSQFNPDYALTYFISPAYKWPVLLRFYHLKLCMHFVTSPCMIFSGYNVILSKYEYY